MIVALNRFARIAAVMLALLVVGAHPAFSGSPAPIRSLASVVGSDGLLRRGVGTSGSFDARGWRVMLDGSGAPRFVPAQSDSTGVAENANWDRRFGGGRSVAPDGPVYAVAIDGDEVYIGGRFKSVGGVSTPGVARWDGSRWRSLGTGLNNTVDGIVLALAVRGDTVFVGGQFSRVGWVSVNNLAVWNRVTGVWSQLLLGVSGGDLSYVATLLLHGSDLYIGGRFSAAGNTIANNVARYDGRRCYRFGAGVLGDVFAMGIIGNRLYVGGSFESAGNVPAANVACWDLTASTWSALPGGGIGAAGIDSVYAITTDGSDVYFGGSFMRAGGITARNVARWNEVERAWHPLADGLDGRVVSMMSAGGKIFVGGASFSVRLFDGSTTILANRSLVRYDRDRDEWLAVGYAYEDAVTSSPVVYSMAFAGGPDMAIVGSSASSAAGFRLVKLGVGREDWLDVGASVAVMAHALLATGGDLLAGGTFDAAGGKRAHRIARWHDGTWSAIGSGFDSGSVDAIAAGGGMIYAGGTIVTASGDSVNGIAMWDGSHWGRLGPGLTGAPPGPNVVALAVSGSDLYAAGWFTRTGSQVLNGVARWDGSQWWPLGSGLVVTDDSGRTSAAQIRSLVAGGDLLYVAGSFNATGDLALANLAVWNMKTGAWSPAPDGGPAEPITTMAFGNGRLYVAAGGISPEDSTSAIFFLDPASGSWTQMVSGIVGSVNALSFGGDVLYVGGVFKSIGGVEARNIARFDGESWRSLGSGTNAAVTIVTADSAGVFCGGPFSVAGLATSNYVGRWTTSAPASVAIARGEAVTGGAFAGVAPNPIGGEARFVLQLLATSDVSLDLYMADGRRAATIAAAHLPAGRQTITWDRGDLPAGVYVCRLRVGERVESRTVILGR
jgi:hypothetical protein